MQSLLTFAHVFHAALIPGVYFAILRSADLNPQVVGVIEIIHDAFGINCGSHKGEVFDIKPPLIFWSDEGLPANEV